MTIEKTSTLMAACLLIAGICSCSPDIGQETAKDSISLSPTSVEATSDGISQAISIEASGAWTASTTVNWVKITPDRGDASTREVTITISKNKTTSVRTTNIRFSCGKEFTALKVSQEAEQSALTYTNPVISATSADPSCIRGEDGYFYVGVTGGNIKMRKSPNLVNWTDLNTALSSRPMHITYENGDKPAIWAPDFNYINGKYVMYYALHTDENPPKSAVGVATADKPEGPYTDRGCLLRYDKLPYAFSETQIRKGCIDPEFLSAEGHNYLFVGSFQGIFAMELSADGLSLKEGTRLTQITNNKYEGAYIYQRNGYYYLLLSAGRTLIPEGGSKADITYNIRVGRSTSPLGPYTNRQGKDLMTADLLGYPLLQGNDKYFGPGHNGEIFTDDNGDDWLIYHTYNDSPDDAARHMCIDKVTWTSDGWPTMNDGKGPSAGGAGPVFRNN